jgi:hypothetical protein
MQRRKVLCNVNFNLQLIGMLDLLIYTYSVLMYNSKSLIAFYYIHDPSKKCLQITRINAVHM